MQRWLTTYVDAFAMFLVVAFATLNTQFSFAAETDWDPHATSSTSTLAIQVAPQNFDLPAPVFMMIHRHAQHAQAESLQLRPAQPTNPKIQISKAQTPKTPSPTTAENRSLAAQRSKPVPSPFTKWVAPQANRGQQVKVDSVKPDPKPFANAKPLPAPQLARRISPRQSAARKSTRLRDNRPTSSRKKTQTKEKAQSTKKTASNHAQTRTLPVVSFPVPLAEPTTPSAKINPANLPPLTPGQQRLRTKIRRTLNHYYQRPLNTRDRSPWEMMHALLSFEVDSKLLRGGPKGKPISAVGWLCFNQVCKRRTLMYVGDDGEMHVRVGPALQGHRGQLLAMLAQAKVSKDYPMQIEGHDFTVGDLVKMEMKTCYPRTELTFKLIGLMHYLDSDATWVNDQGMAWDIPRLISEELRQPVRGAACGGTHRLTGLTLAYKTRQLRGEPVDGQYLKAQKFINRYQQYAYRLQNRDGSFSTEWFRGPGREKSIDRNLKTTGHLLEWLLYAANEKQLRHQKTAQAANYLATLMDNNRYKNWESGPLGHAVHALFLYDRMVFSPYDKPKNLPVAGKSKRTASASSKR